MIRLLSGIPRIRERQARTLLEWMIVAAIASAVTAIIVAMIAC